jgi:hypothetical protein
MDKMALTWDIVRANRNALLGNSDWTQLSDAPLTPEQKESWTDYRRQLRDLPQPYTTPEEVIYPDMPTA